MAIPAAMAGDEREHGESGEVNAVKLAEFLADGVISEDDYNRMISKVVESGLNQSPEVTPEETITYQMVTETETETTETKTKSVELTETESISETETELQVLNTVAEVQEQNENTDSETVTVEKGLIEQIISALQDLLGV